MIEDRLIASGVKRIAGVDEAGRGSCAGPLVVAAVVLKEIHAPVLADVVDSKKLTASKREALYSIIIEQSIAYSIISIEPSEIDEIGLHRCNLEGMRRAISALDCELDYVLTDGYSIEGLVLPNLAVWKGDSVTKSIAAASILAKVFRDRIMTELDIRYPGYGFADHKGYVTATHQAAIEKMGVTNIHRKSYANVARAQ